MIILNINIVLELMDCSDSADDYIIFASRVAICKISHARLLHFLSHAFGRVPSYRRDGTVCSLLPP